MNVKQRKVIKKIAEGETQTKAYADVYGVSDEVAKTNASRLLSKANVSSQLERVLRERGIDEGSIADTLHDIRKSHDWRAKSDYVEKSSRFLGYGQESQTQVNVMQGLTIVKKDADEKDRTK